ncbi:MAG: signal peptidase I [Lachnospiraceae bacterium]|nr:signal peptidase I [Lachnospiraceae bacterium]
MRSRVTWLCIAELALVFLLTRFCVLPGVYIPTASMEPTIAAGSMVMVSRGIFMEPLERGSIVVFRRDGTRYCKRIIGLPGETVEVRGGVTFIDGEVLAEPYAEPDLSDYGPYKVPDGNYFLMGDNRDESWDSREWEAPTASREELTGKVFVVWYQDGFCWKWI